MVAHPAESVMDEDDAELNDHDSDPAGSFHAPTEIDAESVDASTTSSSTLDSESPDTHHKTPQVLRYCDLYCIMCRCVM